MKLLKSGELAEILNITVQSVSNYRREGMPYHSFNGVGYLYTIDSIKWVLLFKTKDNYLNKRYKDYRKTISRLQDEVKELKHDHDFKYKFEEHKKIVREAIRLRKQRISYYVARL